MVEYEHMFYYLKSKLNNKRIVIAFLLTFSLVFGFMPKVVGQTADQLAKQKQQKQQQLDAINKKISDYQAQIKQKQAVAGSLKNELAILDLQIAQTEAQIEATNGEIDATNLDIADTTDQIVKTVQNIDKQKLLLKDLIAQINDLDQMSPLEIALENDNFTEFLDQLQYTTNIQERSQEILNEIKILKVSLEQKNLDLKKQKSELDNLKEQLTITENSLSGQRSEKSTLLSRTRGQEASYQKLLTDSKNLEGQLEKEINDLDSQIAAKLGNRKQAPVKGLFAWPMDGVLTQGYGNTGFTSLGYNFHNGIDIAAPAGTTIYAAADGVVVGTGTGNGAYGNWVTIKHTLANGRAVVSLYGHMTRFVLKNGQQVKQNDVVGYEGNTGNTTRLLYGPHRGFHLHFTVFDAEGYGVAPGTLTKIYGPYQVPYGATYNPIGYLK